MASSVYNGIKAFLLHNKGIKALSLLLAVMTWYSVRGVIGVVKVVDGIPIEVRARDGLAVLSQSEQAVTVTFKGAQSDIARLTEDHVREQIRAVVYAKSRQPVQAETIPISPRNIEGAPGVRVAKISKPSSTVVELDAETERHFLVKPRCIEKPELGQVSSVKCDPPTVRVHGPRQKLDEMKNRGFALDTEPIDLRETTHSFHKRVKLLPPSDQWGARIEPPEVVVSVTIERKRTSRSFPDIPVTALVSLTPAVMAEVRPAKATVTITGRDEVLSGLSPEEMRIFVDCSGLDSSVTYQLPLTVHVRPDLDLSATVDPPTAEVALREAL